MAAIAFKVKKDNYTGGDAVTPSDSTEVQFSGLYVGANGNVAVEFGAAMPRTGKFFEQSVTFVITA